MSHHTRVSAAVLWLMSIPVLASAQTAAGAIDGAVKDGSGSAVAGAIVTLDAVPPAAQRTTVADDAGAFHFADVAPGNYKVTIAANGFASWTADVAEGTAESPAPLAAVLQVAPVSASVDVLPPHELAAEQLKTEEKQRVLGVFPHYMVTYDPNAAPLSTGQKFHLGFKTLVDPVTLASTAISSGIQQARNKYPDFGQGAQGYATYFGAQYASHLSHTMINHVILQAVFHQDPRYFYKDTGGFWSRVAYSFETAFVCKGDNGKWQPDYSDVIGGAAASQMSRLWYPYTSRPYVRLWHDVLLSFGGRFEDHLVEQFVARHFTTHTHGGGGSRVEGILKEGTPVSLISVDDLTPKTAPTGGPAAFVLANDIQVAGATVAKVGAVASGQVSYAGEPADPQAIHVAIEKVRLKVGNVDVPLRSTQVKGVSAPLQFHKLEGSGRIAIELYVAQDVPVALGK